MQHDDSRQADGILLIFGETYSAALFASISTVAMLGLQAQAEAMACWSHAGLFQERRVSPLDCWRDEDF